MEIRGCTEAAVAPFVVRTGVVWGGCGPVKVPTLQLECLVRSRVDAGRGSRNAWVLGSTPPRRQFPETVETPLSWNLILFGLFRSWPMGTAPEPGVKAGRRPPGAHPEGLALAPARTVTPSRIEPPARSVKSHGSRSPAFSAHHAGKIHSGRPRSLLRSVQWLVQ